MDPLTIGMLAANIGGSILQHQRAKKQKFPTALYTGAYKRASELESEANKDYATGRIGNLQSALRSSAVKSAAGVQSASPDVNVRNQLLSSIYQPTEVNVAEMKDKIYSDEVAQNLALKEQANQIRQDIETQKAEFEAGRKAQMGEAISSGISGVGSALLSGMTQQANAKALTDLMAGQTLSPEELTYLKTNPDKLQWYLSLPSNIRKQLVAQ